MPYIKYMQKIYLGILVLVIFGLGGGYIIMNPPAAQPAPNGNQPSVANKAGQKNYTLAEVTKHNSQTSCWTAIAGQVYDLTPFIAQHPGGVDAIMVLCGKDGTAAFTGQHGAVDRGRSPQKELAGLEIGVLK